MMRTKSSHSTFQLGHIELVKNWLEVGAWLKIAIMVGIAVSLKIETFQFAASWHAVVSIFICPKINLKKYLKGIKNLGKCYYPKVFFFS